MHVDVHFPTDRPPLPCLLEVMDHIEQINREQSDTIEQQLALLDQKRASILANDEDEDPDIMMGDWQTWK